VRSRKVAFVTGGAPGIGAALAARLVGEGAAVELDVRSYPAFERAIAEAIQRSGRIDLLFNNAASPCDPGRATRSGKTFGLSGSSGKPCREG
jgi:NAD(P)-dependent dehydrogenase (short-subunit alcohol dehydrogenase family)